MKNILLLTALLLKLSAASYSQNIWHYENQKHSKGSISGQFTYTGEGKWIEKNNIEGPFYFDEFSKTGEETILFDKKRNVYVKLTQTEMWASWKNNVSWQKYYNGVWSEWVYENQPHAKGEISGKISYLGNYKWLETNNIEGPFNFEFHSYIGAELILF